MEDPGKPRKRKTHCTIALQILTCKYTLKLLNTHNKAFFRETNYPLGDETPLGRQDQQDQRSFNWKVCERDNVSQDGSDYTAWKAGTPFTFFEATSVI